MYTVYGMKSSGNCYKVQLVLEQLGTPYRWVEVDSAAGGTRTSAFLAMNPNGKVPLLEVDPGRYLPESNAILYFLAEGTRLWPADRWSRALALQWMFFEQYSHEPYVAVARFIARWLPADHPRRAELPRLVERGHQALAVMERHLAAQPFMAGGEHSIADIALFAYTHCAADGGIAARRLSVDPRLARPRARAAGLRADAGLSVGQPARARSSECSARGPRPARHSSQAKPTPIAPIAV